jgi:segregation and condensation protein A
MEKEDVEHFMDITLTRISLSEKIDEILNRLSPGKSVSFHALFTDTLTRRGMILTFIALLEIARLGLIRIWQRPAGGEIELQLK